MGASPSPSSGMPTGCSEASAASCTAAAAAIMDTATAYRARTRYGLNTCVGQRGGGDKQLLRLAAPPLLHAPSSPSTRSPRPAARGRPRT